MNHTALILTLSSALIHGTRDLVTKKAEDKELFIFCYELAAMLLFAPLAGVILARYGLPEPSAWIWCFWGAVCHAFYYLALARTLEQGDLSLVYPIMRAAPVLILLGSVIFLGEAVTLPGAAGIIIVVLGVYAMQLKELSYTAIFSPFRAMSADKSIRWAFITMLIVAVYSLVDKAGVERINPVLYLFLISFGALVVFSPYIILRKPRGAIKQECLRAPQSIAVNGIFVSLGYLLILFAYTLERISYVQAVRQVSILVAVFLGGRCLNERYGKIRLAASGLVMVGTIIIVLAG